MNAITADVDIHTVHGGHVYKKRTNIVMDEALVEAAKKVTGIATMRELVDHALRELVRRHAVARIATLEGAVDWDGDLDAMRRGRAPWA